MSRNSGPVVEKIGHAKCGSSDALAVYLQEDGTYNGYCWSCKTFEADPYGTGIRQEVKVSTHKLSVGDIYHNFAAADLPDRRLRKDTLEYFGVRVSVSPVDGVTVGNHYYPYNRDNVLVAYKDRVVATKDFYWTGDSKGTLELFGQYQARMAGGRKLFITGGEVDVMSLYQALKDMAKGTEYANLNPAVVCARNGEASTAKELSEQKDFLAVFQEIILVLDNDKAGNDAADEVMRLFPEKCKRVTLPMKDVNEMLKAGKEQAIKQAVIWQAQSYKPSGMVTVAEVFEKARQPAQWGIPWPWATLTKKTYGINRGMLYGVGAGVGCGKTTFWHQLEQHLIHLGLRIGTVMLEEPNHKTLKMLAGKMVGKDFYNPTTQYSQDELDAALQSLNDKVILYNHKEDKTWDSIKPHIRHLVLVEGIKDIIIDPISAMTSHLDSSKTNDELNRMFGELAAMAETLDFTAYYSSHLNPPESGQPHEEGGRVKANQFTGSRAMIKYSQYIIGLERDTQAPEEATRNTVTCRLLKDREFGNTGFFSMMYDRETITLKEVPPIEKPAGVTY